MLNSRLSMIGAASIAYLLAGPVLGERQSAMGQPSAGSCTKATQISDANPLSKLSVRTIFVAETEPHKVFEITVYRNNNEKNSKFLNAKNRTMQTTMNSTVNTSPTFNVTATIIRRDNPGAHSISCVYNVDVRFVSLQEASYFETTYTAENNSPCEDIKSICDDCELNCEKSYNEDNFRWTTTFTISD